MTRGVGGGEGETSLLAGKGRMKSLRRMRGSLRTPLEKNWMLRPKAAPTKVAVPTMLLLLVVVEVSLCNCYLIRVSVGVLKLWKEKRKCSILITRPTRPQWWRRRISALARSLSPCESSSWPFRVSPFTVRVRFDIDVGFWYIPVWGPVAVLTPAGTEWYLCGSSG